MSSAADTVNSGTDLQNKDAGTPRPNPVAQQVMVNVTGTKANGHSSRELFSEETTTVLVFRDGAVVRLKAAVSVGQLVFLTNKRTNQEVVCQILRKRSYKPTTCYVELQFTEARPDYWGVAFPDGEKSAAEFRIVEQVQAEEVTAEESETSVAPRTAEGVDQMKRELQALREQLKALEKKNVEEAAANAAKHKEELAAVNDPVPVKSPVAEKKPDLLMPAANDKTTAPRAVVGMALPIQKEQPKPHQAPEPHDVPEELLPKPELDFSQAPKDAANFSEVKMIRMPLLGSKTRVRALTAVLVIVAAAAVVYLKLWTYLPLPIRKGAQVAGTVTPKSVAPKPHNGVSDDAKAADPANAAANAPPNAAPVSDTKDTRAQSTARPEETAQPAKAEKHPAEAASKKTISPREKPARKKDSAQSAVEANSYAIPSDAPVLPAKLLKPANPVYPPGAMTNYITGDVKAEVEVDAQGHVISARVLSGPQALRDAAMQALKQYEYEPATQAGQPVPSKSTEVVKFWFNP